MKHSLLIFLLILVLLGLFASETEARKRTPWERKHLFRERHGGKLRHRHGHKVRKHKGGKHRVKKHHGNHGNRGEQGYVIAEQFLGTTDCGGNPLYPPTRLTAIYSPEQCLNLPIPTNVSRSYKSACVGIQYYPKNQCQGTPVETVNGQICLPQEGRNSSIRYVCSKLTNVLKVGLYSDSQCTYLYERNYLEVGTCQYTYQAYGNFGNALTVQQLNALPTFLVTYYSSHTCSGPTSNYELKPNSCVETGFMGLYGKMIPPF